MRAIWIFVFFILCIGCTPIKIITARNYPARPQTIGSIENFLKNRRLDGFPVLQFDSAYSDELPSFFFRLGLFSKHGDYISIDNEEINCPDRNYQYVMLRHILKNGDVQYKRDTIVERMMLVKEGVDQQTIIASIEKDGKSSIASNQWQKIEKISRVHLDLYQDQLRTLQGEPVNFQLFYSDYLILQEFMMAGKPALLSTQIRRLIRDIEQLNKEFGNRIQLVLIIRDQVIISEKLSINE